MINISYSKFSQKEKMLLFVAAGLIAIFVCRQFILKPIGRQLKCLAEEIVVKDKEAKIFHKILSQRESITKEYESIKGYLKAMNRDDARALLLRKAEEWSAASGARLIEMMPYNTVSEDLVHKASVDIELEGTMKQVTKFMYIVCKSDVIYSIDKLQLTIPSSTSDVLKVAMIITIVTFKKEREGGMG